jgi:hypothetical protein
MFNPFAEETERNLTDAKLELDYQAMNGGRSGLDDHPRRSIVQRVRQLIALET